MTVIMIILAVIGGATLSIQAAINGQLGSSVGVFKSAFLTFSVGALVTALLIFFFEPKQAVSLMDVPKWQLLGALCGVPYIVIMVLAVQRIGTAVATVAVILGQLAMSMLIDNFGWLNNEAIPFSVSRFGAVVCLSIALFFIYSSSKPQPEEDKPPSLRVKNSVTVATVTPNFFISVLLNRRVLSCKYIQSSKCSSQVLPSAFTFML
ncbi:Uncharacterized protein conserved in bacteria [Enterobacter hormaechei]|nr:Uncharacterized protein conserved in bacteria [Enterobacter hormaechei]CZW58945.1 Uncharacterized protein conserved in bacteria [Enterobacter hormaechei]